MGFARCSGILMPLSSLPGGYGIGSMGAPARKFVDFLAAAGQTIWQILPVGPTGYADSPYQSCSAFAGNPYFIDLDQLVKDGLLTRRDFAKIHWGGDAAHIDYGTLYEKRFDVLRKAYANFLKQRPVPGYDTPYPDDWYRFQFLSCEWLPDYCLYMAIKRDNGMVDWQQWPEALRLRDPAALAAFKEEHAEEVGFWAFVQYEFDRQWRALHAYAKSKGVSIMGDIPIYVAADSADAWAGRELFETDADGKPRRVAPPRLCLVDPPHPPRPVHLRHPAHRPLPRLRHLLGYPGWGKHRPQRPLGERPRHGPVPHPAQRPGRAAHRGRGSGRDV